MTTKLEICCVSLVCIVFLIVIEPCRSEFDLRVRTKQDLVYGYGYQSYGRGWRFPRDRPFHYANSTQDIPQHFLSVPISALPDGDGVWVLRYKDFSGVPRTFTGGKKKDTTKSVISFGTMAISFKYVAIKALTFGDVQLDLIPGNYPSSETEIEKIHLFGNGIDNNCTISDLNDEKLRWTEFEVQLKSTSQVHLEASIHHPKSFLLLDEMIVHFESEDIHPSTGHENFINSLKTEENRVVRCTEVF